MLDLNITETVELVLITIRNHAKRVKESKGSLCTELVLEGHAHGGGLGGLLGRCEGSSRGDEGGDDDRLHFGCYFEYCENEGVNGKSVVQAKKAFQLLVHVASNMLGEFQIMYDSYYKLLKIARIWLNKKFLSPLLQLWEDRRSHRQTDKKVNLIPEKRWLSSVYIYTVEYLFSFF